MAQTTTRIYDLEALQSRGFSNISNFNVGPMNYICVGYFSSMQFQILQQLQHTESHQLPKVCCKDVHHEYPLAFKVNASINHTTTLMTKYYLQIWRAPQKINFIPKMSFFWPWTISNPEILTSENFSLLPMSTTWLQFSTFLKGHFIGGLVALFQLTEPGATLSKVSSNTHLVTK